MNDLGGAALDGSPFRFDGHFHLLSPRRPSSQAQLRLWWLCGDHLVDVGRVGRVVGLAPNRQALPPAADPGSAPDTSEAGTLAMAHPTADRAAILAAWWASISSSTHPTL